MTAEYAAIVLAGGGSRRMGGRDKPALPVGGRPMVRRVLDAVADASPRVVVGPARPQLDADVVQVREEPPGGGPVAALAAGLAVLHDGVELVAVLAADLPFLTPADVDALRRAAGTDDHDGAVMVDAEGRRQWLCGVWRAPVLRDRLAELGPPAGQSMRALVSGLRPRSVERGEVSRPPPWYDCDTDDDYRSAKEWA